ncbi:hypothetical protein HDU98_007343 [Podochytrium sp. JEL0797]|nr:hypothetical protein HDU98_007343 [Podochytrium sp. JEL0797]
MLSITTDKEKHKSIRRAKRREYLKTDLLCSSDEDVTLDSRSCSSSAVSFNGNQWRARLPLPEALPAEIILMILLIALEGITFPEDLARAVVVLMRLCKCFKAILETKQATNRWAAQIDFSCIVGLEEIDGLRGLAPFGLPDAIFTSIYMLSASSSYPLRDAEGSLAYALLVCSDLGGLDLSDARIDPQRLLALLEVGPKLHLPHLQTLDLRFANVSERIEPLKDITRLLLDASNIEKEHAHVAWVLCADCESEVERVRCLNRPVVCPSWEELFPELAEEAVVVEEAEEGETVVEEAVAEEVDEVVPRQVPCGACLTLQSVWRGGA